MRVNEQPLLFKAVLYGLVTLILIEVLRPILFLTSSHYLSVFIGFIIMTFILNLLKTPALIRYLLKTFMVIGGLAYMYHDNVGSIPETLQHLVTTLTGEIPTILTQGFYGMSAETRTFLLFLLLWMITYLIRYWIEVKQRILLFYLTLILFVATVDTFTDYDATYTIYRLLGYGFILLGLLALGHMMDKYQMKVSWPDIWRLLLPLILMLAMSGAIVKAFPIYGPLLPDPVPFLQTKTGMDSASRATVSKAGYGLDDTQLGGPFVEDDSLVFEAKVRQRQYWKVETKDTYTSKGWEQSTNSPSIAVDMNETIHVPTDEGALEQADIRMVEQYPFIVHPYELVSIDAERPVSFTYQEHTQQVMSTLNAQGFPLDRYRIQFETPTYSLEQLLDTSMVDMAQLSRDLGMTAYVQLPDTLPSRVRDLAHDITDSSESVYEKAKAIEQYFEDESFTYDRTNVAVPGEGEDYVDQFLFDTQTGYCDNFSSSMVVMLRALDIPARWVKGFAPGELMVDEAGDRTYRISNNEAHSWVEAYMPGIGWMAFEPTIGFTGNTQVENDLAMDGEETLEQDPSLEATEEQLPEDDNEVVEEEEEVAETESQRPDEQIEDDQMRTGYGVLPIVMSGIVILLILAYVFRRKWLHRYLLLRFRTATGDWRQFERQYQVLVKQLARFGMKRASEETLMAYAKRVDVHYGTENMQQLTKIYEQGVYGNLREIEDWQRLQQLWEELLQRISH